MDKIDINSADAQSEDVVAENVRQLGELFPELLTEGHAGPSVNIDVLKQLVGDSSVSEIDEKYGLSWFGKRDARKMALTPSLGTLLPRPEESEDWDNTKNLMIEGDNLEVLKLLQKSYSGKVKLIYIDPPYNTGKDFVYPDNYQDNIKNYLELTGQTEEGRKTTSNTESSGRFHTDWLNMMYPRLKLARNLLSEDGVVFLSIDDTELAGVRSMFSEIFGDANEIATLIHQRAKGGGNAKHVVKGHDYIVTWAKNSLLLPPLRRDKVVQGKVEVIDGIEYLIDDDVLRKKFGKYDKSDGDRRCFYEEVEQYKGKAKLAEIDDQIVRGELFLTLWANGMHAICRRTPIASATSKLYSIVKVLSEEGLKDLSTLGLEDLFSYPKPVELLTSLVLAGSPSNEGSVVLDFFAGSGTTGQAVMEQNALDGGNRQFILVQLPEPLLEENKEQAAALAFCKEHNLEENIAALTAERLRRAGAKVRSENPMFAGDVGFRVFKLAESNIRAWNPLAEDLEGTLRTSEDHLVEGRSELDVLYEILLKRGLDLCIPIETKEIAGHHVNAVGGGCAVCVSRQPDRSTRRGGPRRGNRCLARRTQCRG